MNTNYKLTLPALFLSLGLLLPMAFHITGLAGKIFLPMHIPVLMGGLILGWQHGLFLGIFTPLISSFLTGMPPLYPMALIMAVELALYGAAAGYLYRTKRCSLLLSLVFALIAGRIGIAMMLGLFAESLGIHLTPWAYIAASTAQGAVGIIIQIVALPSLVRKLEFYLENQKNLLRNEEEV